MSSLTASKHSDARLRSSTARVARPVTTPSSRQMQTNLFAGEDDPGSTREGDLFDFIPSERPSVREGTDDYSSYGAREAIFQRVGDREVFLDDNSDSSDWSCWPLGAPRDPEKSADKPTKYDWLLQKRDEIPDANTNHRSPSVEECKQVASKRMRDALEEHVKNEGLAAKVLSFGGGSRPSSAAPSIGSNSFGERQYTDLYTCESQEPMIGPGRSRIIERPVFDELEDLPDF